MSRRERTPSRGATPPPHVACSDCERPGPGLIAQPVNTASSVAFVVAAVPIWRGARGPARARWRAVAVAVAGAGLGSAAYHGPGGRLGKVLHDRSLGVLAVAIAAAIGGSPRGPGRRPSATAALAVVLHATSRTGGPLCDPDSRWQGHAAWHVLAAAALALAAADAAGGGAPDRMARG